jgi:hypothetical protein
MDAATVASLATAAGTLVLAVATFSSTRSANRSARIAEQAMMLGLTPVLAPSRLTDPPERVGFIDGHTTSVAGGMAAVAHSDGNFYFIVPLRNVGAGLAVLHGWHVHVGPPSGHVPPLERFRRQSRDLYVPPGDTGFWQGAIRDDEDPMREGLAEAIAEGRRINLDILYGDHQGGQRTISRLGLVLEDDGWLATVARHWRLDGIDPRAGSPLS